MPEVTIECLMDGKRPILLLTENERLRIQSRIDDLRGASLEYRRQSLAEESVALSLQADALAKEIEIDTALRSEPGITTVTVAFDEPTLADLDAVRSQITDLGKAKQTAYERLNPRAIDGWDGDLPMDFYVPISDACYASIDPNPSEDRRFFWMRSRHGRKDS